ncbi:MAG: peptidylprolyl isomerase [Chloroherpetonaceae bacterium]|nr:peptidylprolyl isomerase [Chthonomonadaceae bacterium]MDW8207042.1 peptidylprolyl isomerase [Chloroherpetonaceae bacterium]
MSSLRIVLRRILLALCVLGSSSTAMVASAQSNPRVEMVIEKRGTLVIELYPKAAPKTVAHFLALTQKKFYDGILFHRVVPNFVAQAGDPASRKYKPSDLNRLSAEEIGAKYQLGTGGSGKTVPLEASLPHDRGTLGLARAQDPNSGDSQFFLNLVPNHSLDGNYCVFGKVIRGLDVMDRIQNGDRIKSVRVLKNRSGK